MNPSYVISYRASEDIDQIIDYIAEDNLNAAISFENKLFESFELLAEHPKIGHERLEIAFEGVRFWVFKKRYLIVYQESEVLEIVRVLSGYQNLLSIFDSEH
jgi:toxin ParE1/3/4